MKRFTAILIISFFTGLVSNGQGRIDYSSMAKMMSSGGSAQPVPKDYAEAAALAEKATEELNAGNIKAADSLINKSIVTYPTLTVFGYAKALGKLSDIVGANLIADKAIDKVKSLGGNIFIIYTVPFGPRINNEMINERALYIFLLETYNLNNMLGEKARIIKSMEAMTSMNLKPYPGKGIDQDIESQNYLRQEEATFKGDYTKAISLIKAKRTYKLYSKDQKNYELTRVYEYAEDYANMIDLAKGNSNRYMKAEGLFRGYALMGNSALAMEQYKKMTEGQRVSNETQYYLALVSIAKMDFKTAILQLDTSLSLRISENNKFRLVIDKWRVYKAYGDAYAGLKDFGKAKDHYNLALLSDPDYKPAITGLANLGVQYQKEINDDKTPPVIAITEPAPSRGLKITSAAANVMVKGLATDPSGIKEVSINGVKVYTQLTGAFWGDVPMVNGINKIVVTAIDMADNKATQTFEIEKKTAQVVAANEVAPVVEKEGKNYCLLIAAQNYADGSIPSLANPIADAVKLKLILKKNYGYEESNISSLFNPSNNDIRRKLLELSSAIQPEDNLVIFYAGHGIWVEKEKKGYWLMTDAQYKDVNTWLPNKDVLDLIAKLPSRHTLLITDACFSGSVFKTRGVKPGASAAIREMENKISRVAITSGNDTEVPDESVFIKYLVKALSENKDQYLTAQKMFINQILEAVMTESKTEPRYGTLELAGHVGGDFIFSKK